MLQKKYTNKEFAKIFDGAAGSYDKISNVYCVKRRQKWIGGQAKGKCLEVGAGSGEISKMLSKKHDVTAVDISPKMVEEIKKKLKIRAVVCDAEKLPFKKKSFDSVIAAEMIYYLDKPEKFLKEAYRVLKPNGRVILTSANNITKIYTQIRSLLRKIGFSGMYFDDGIENFYNSKQIRELLIKQGFRLIQEEKVILLPFEKFDRLNKVLEKTFLNCFGSFIFVCAEKDG